MRTMQRPLQRMLVTTMGLCVLSGMAGVGTPRAAIAQQPVTVTVDAAAAQGALNNPALYHNQSGPNSRLGAGDVARVQDLGAEVVRVWIKPDAYYDEASGTSTS